MPTAALPTYHRESTDTKGHQSFMFAKTVRERERVAFLTRRHDFCRADTQEIGIRQLGGQGEWWSERA